MSTPYDPEHIKGIIRQAQTVDQFISAENARLKLKQQARLAELKGPGVAADALQKQYDFVAKTMGSAKSRLHWASRRKFLKAKVLQGKVSEDVLALIPEEYSPEAAKQVQQMGTRKEWPEPQDPSALQEKVELLKSDPEAFGEIFGRSGIDQKELTQLATRLATTSGPMGSRVDRKEFISWFNYLKELMGGQEDFQGTPSPSAAPGRRELGAPQGG